MRTKVSWLILISTCLVLFSMVLASCGPAPTTPAPAPTSQPAPAPSTSPAPAPAPAPAANTPAYGGILTIGQTSDPQFFDEAGGTIYQATTVMLTNERLVIGDWSKGSQGTKESMFNTTEYPTPNLRRGAIAESWEVTAPGTYVFHLRKGVRFINKPPTNGREVTSDDVVFSLEREFKTPGGTIPQSYPWDRYVESITATDKYTVTLKGKIPYDGVAFDTCAFYLSIVPKDAVQQFGNLKDWRNAIGTGPFMLTDFVSNSSVTFKKNPEYWDVDPLHTSNHVPYVDGVKFLTITDRSTRIAAMRTGKLDQLGNVAWDDADSLIKYNPNMKYNTQYNTLSYTVAWRVDKPNLPFYKTEVRQALTLAVDKNAILKGFYGGQGTIYGWPILDSPDWKDTFIPFDQLPANVKELYGYNPDKSKQMLAAAGYPNGFKFSVVTTAPYVDLMSIVKDYLGKVNVDMTIDVRETGAQNSLMINKSYAEAICWPTHAYQPFRLVDEKVGENSNTAMVNDKVVQDMYDYFMKNYLDEGKKRAELKKNIPYMLEQCWYLPLPNSTIYTMWQPWLKGYGGETTVGYFRTNTFVNYVWLDQAQKAAR